ncbi:MAG: hypothetical protein DRJ40_03685 [Thermoprotei archaeon]|nr:MAG: hypothetical protein DRJ40_03685 [Thermoprotei archaeon]
MKYLTIEEASIFHGHLGPFLALGYVAGRFCVEVLKPETEHDLEAVVKVPLRTPYTCILDGIQCSTKCTLGKGNIRVEKGSEDDIVITIRSKRTSRGVVLKVKNEVIARILSMDLEKGARYVLSRGIDELFDVQYV